VPKKAAGRHGRTPGEPADARVAAIPSDPGRRNRSRIPRAWPLTPRSACG